MVKYKKPYKKNRLNDYRAGVQSRAIAKKREDKIIKPGEYFNVYALSDWLTGYKRV